MESWRHFAVFIAAAAFFYLPWRYLVYSILRIFGVTSGIGFSEKIAERNNASLRKLGRQRYVLIEGVLMWGFPIFAASTIADFAVHKYPGTVGYEFSLGLMMLKLLCWSAAGFVIGVEKWSKKSAWDQELDG
jgi:hypothetical protein